MRTAIIIASGMIFLVVCLFAGKLFGKEAAESISLGAKTFIPLWFVAAGVNMWIGLAWWKFG